MNEFHKLNCTTAGVLGIMTHYYVDVSACKCTLIPHISGVTVYKPSAAEYLVKK